MKVIWFLRNESREIQNGPPGYYLPELTREKTQRLWDAAQVDADEIMELRKKLRKTEGTK